MAIWSSILDIVKNSLIRSRNAKDVFKDKSCFSGRDGQRDMKG
jgi:hypothetical protein